MIFKKKDRALFVLYVIKQGKFEDFNCEVFYNYKEAKDFIKELREDFGEFLITVQLYNGERIKEW